MLIPTKHENLNRNLLVIGAEILNNLKKKNYNTELLFQKIKSSKSVSLEQFYNSLLFLWLAELIEVDGVTIYLNKKDVSN